MTQNWMKNIILRGNSNIEITKGKFIDFKESECTQKPMVNKEYYCYNRKYRQGIN